jgi:hypothetical protein
LKCCRLIGKFHPKSCDDSPHPSALLAAAEGLKMPFASNVSNSELDQLIRFGLSKQTKSNDPIEATNSCSPSGSTPKSLVTSSASTINGESISKSLEKWQYSPL